MSAVAGGAVAVPAYRIVIPARHAASRLPGKPLRDIAGAPLIEHVWRRARASAASEVLIATDDARIRDAARGFGAEVEMTRADHPSGTDRLAEVAARRGWDAQALIVNLQGDEPLIPPALLDRVAADLAAHPDAAIATAATPIHAVAELADPGAVKVVLDARGYALYFSRAPIPWLREGFAGGVLQLDPAVPHYRHIGLYAYRAGFLARYGALAPAPPEQGEALEQLRALWHGERIHCLRLAEAPPPGVDTEADLDRVRALLA